MEIFSSMHLSNRKKKKKRKKKNKKSSSSMVQKTGGFMLGSRLKEGIEA